MDLEHKSDSAVDGAEHVTRVTPAHQLYRVLKNKALNCYRAMKMSRQYFTVFFS